jgi:hypothetical protein
MSEFYEKAYPNWKSLIWYALLPLAAGFFMYLTYRDFRSLILSVVVAVFFCGILSVQLDRSKRAAYDAHLLNKLDNQERIIEFSDDITYINPMSGGKSIFDYKHVRRFIESKNLYILLLPHRLSLYFEKDKFTIGDAAAFKTYIKAKCVCLK